MNGKLERYKEKFIKYFIDLNIECWMAEQELEAWLEMMDEDDLDYEHPEFDAAECISYWDV